MIDVKTNNFHACKNDKILLICKHCNTLLKPY